MDLTPRARPVPLSLLFWLKAKITFRGYQRSSSALVGVVLGLLVFLPLLGVIAVGSYMGFVGLPGAGPENLLRAVLLGAYLFWLVSPMLGFSLNESFDVTKLFIYPISVRRILVGAIAGSLLDFPVLFLLPVLASALLGFASGALGTLLVGVALLLFLSHTLALGQSILLATSGMLRSRRYRDCLMVVVPLIWIVYYVVQQMIGRGSLKIDWQAALASPAWDLVNYLPPGMAARAIVAARAGEPLAAIGWCALLIGVTLATVYLASAVIQKVYAGDTDLFRAKPEQSRPSMSAALSTSPSAEVSDRLPFGVRLSPVATAIFQKEARYMARDPSFKAAFMNLVYTLVIAVFMVMPRHETQVPMKWMVWPAACVVLMSEMRFFYNFFGSEGAAATVLFLFPAARRQILVGKDAVYLLAGGLVNVVLGSVVCAIAGAADELLYIVFCMLLGTAFFVAAGNVLSVAFPMRVVMRGWRVRQMGAGQGCAYGLLYFGASIATLVALLPVAAAVFVPRLWLGEGWLFATLPAAVAYVAGAYLLSLKISEELMRTREVEIMQKLGAEE